MTSIPTAGLIVNYNSGSRLVHCVAALRRSDFGERPLIVVDNGSRDGSGRAVAGQAGVELTVLSHNVGFAAGVNVGLKRLFELRVHELLLLNPDTVVAGNFFAPLQLALADGAAVAGPKLLFDDGQSGGSPGGPRRIWSAGGRVTFGRNVAELTGHRERDRGQHDVARDVSFLPATAWLARRSLFEQVGLFDEAFFCYVEDVDFCVRARAKGLRLRYEPRSIVMHEGSASSGGGYTPLRKYLNALGAFVLLRKHGTPARWCRFVAGELLSLPLAFAYATLQGRPATALWKARGLLDGWRRKPFAGARRAALLPRDAA